MKKLLTFLLLLFILSGCERVVVTSEYKCDDSTMEKRAEFTLTCIKNANPMSDEAPEDWIFLCEEMATHNYCKKTKGFFKWGLSPTGFKACSEAVADNEKAACN